MTDDAYGQVEHHQVSGEAQQVAEEVTINGWSLLKAVFSSDEVTTFSTLIDQIYAQQQADFGREQLLLCHEADQARCLTRYHPCFLRALDEPRLKAIAQQLLGDYHTLMLQNAVISRPESKNHQTAWHRDLPHQNFVSSEPLAINFLVVIDAFNEHTGGTELLPYSHKLSKLPSRPFIARHKLAVVAEPGDVLVFDSMLYHRAGINQSEYIRRSLNNQLSKPFIKPQYEFWHNVPEAFIQTEHDAKLLGRSCKIAKDDVDWRHERLKRAKSNEQN